jgi:hypothetical protein
MKKFTFKKHPKTGPYRTFQKDYTDVKLGNQCVGSITEQSDCTYQMGLIIEDPNSKNDNCKWKWIFLKARAVDEAAARAFLNLRFDEINKKYKLNPIDL